MYELLFHLSAAFYKIVIRVLKLVFRYAFLQTRVPLQQQQLLFNGKEMKNFEKLGALGVRDEDLVMMVSGAPSRLVAFSFTARLEPFHNDG